MSSIDMSPPLKSIESSTDLMIYAESLQSRLDRNIVDNFTSKDLNEIATHLDRASDGISLHRQVGLTGLYRITKCLYKKDENDDEHTTLGLEVNSIEEGIVEGISEGFSVVSVDDFKPSYTVDDFDSQMGLYEKLRGKIVGEYVICHMVNHTTYFVPDDNPGVTALRKHHALGPVRESQIRIFGEQDALLSESKYSDAMTVLNALKKPEQQLAVNSIKEEFARTKDPLKAMINAEPYINQFLNISSDPLVSALLFYLTGGEDRPLVSKPYSFKNLQNIFLDHKGSIIAAKLFPEYWKVVYINDMSSLKEIQISDSGEAFSLENSKKRLYLDMAAIVSGNQTQEFFVPLSSIEPGSFRRLVA